MGMGRVWAKKFKFGENPFLGKIVFDFWGKKTPKMHAHFPIHPRSSFAHAGKLRRCFLLHNFVGCVFFLHDFGSWAFLSLTFTHVGAPSSGWEVAMCEIHDFGFVVYFFLSWIVVLHFARVWEFCFCDVLMVGFFPNVFCCIFPIFTKMKIIFLLPNDFEERPHPL